MGRTAKKLRRRRQSFLPNRPLQYRANLTSVMGGLMGPPEAHHDDGCPDCVAQRPDPIPAAPQLSAQALAAAEQRCEAWLRDNAAERAKAHVSWRPGRRDLTPAEQAHVDRYIDDWLICDAAWPETVAAELAEQAQADGEPEVAQALMARHHARLMGVHALPADPDRPAPKGRTPVLRPADGARLTLRWTPPRPLRTGTYLVLRLYPTADGGWRPAPGLLPFVLPPEVEPGPPERAPDADAQTHNMATTWLQAWAADRDRVAGCAALLRVA